MAIHPDYCVTRRALEERHLSLINDLAEEVSLLALFAGRNNHAEFSRMQRRCAELRTNIVESSRQLQIHRSRHGC